MSPWGSSSFTVPCRRPASSWGISRKTRAVCSGSVFLALAELSRRYLIRFLVFPLQEIEALSKTAEEKQSFTPAQTELPKEYEEIRNSLYALVEKLEKEQRERQDYISAKEHALLQYYQLQTRSHFFINCLKSLYSMLELHREEQMKEMIIAFSRHLRNTFRNSLQLIPLSQELEEVSAYHTILFLDDKDKYALMLFFHNHSVSIFQSFCCLRCRLLWLWLW